ncbi:MAG: hypothetical protein J6O61_10145 [Butyrivibrio sp.]|uniref:hypothetical protein n=1 Tax=Butyrivibrio sp. TaxID=28121 RepID=UPI001B0C022C|nr:hypothetical protein [Butyrivibrio sp.]MBO6241169.1 hypothetical protein [Butyrivibrio sp.]
MADIFSSLSGSYNYVNDMSSLLTDYSSIKSGAYGSLLKSYVKKVGNKNALDAYRETGSTTTTDTASTSTSSTQKASATDTTVTADKYAKYKSSWLDNQLKSYDKDANKTTAADTSVALDTTV